MWEILLDLLHMFHHFQLYTMLLNRILFGSDTRMLLYSFIFYFGASAGTLPSLLGG